MNRPALALLAILIPAVAPLARADEAGDRLASLFDKPDSAQAAGPADGGDGVRCVAYPDLIIRQTGTDTPAPDPAVIIPRREGAQLPCSAAHRRGEIALKTAAFSFLGRKGGFLLFGATDPNGAEPFMVIDASTGKTLYADTMIGNSLKVVSLEAGALHLVFTRGINAPCSLMVDTRGCWAKLAATGAIPRAIAQAPPARSICSASYAAGQVKVPADDPSIVTYEVDMTITPAGKAQVASRGAIGCLPLP